MIEKTKKILGKALFWIVLVGLIYLIFNQFTELTDVASAVSAANKIPFVLGIGLQIIWLLLYAVILKTLYKAVNMDVRYRDVFTTFTTQMTLSVTTPVASFVGIFYESSRIGKIKGTGRTEAFVPLITATLLEYLGILVYLAIGIGILFVNDISFEKEAIAGLVITFVSTIILTIMISAALYPEKLVNANENTLVGKSIRYFVNKVTKNKSEEWIAERIWRLNTTLKALASNKGQLFKGVLLSTFIHAIRMVIFGLMFIAFNVELNPAAIVTGYTLVYVFSVASPTPLGIGVVETVVPLILTSMGVPGSAAFLIVLAYRAITVWMIVIYGFIAYKIQDRRSNSLVKKKE